MAFVLTPLYQAPQHGHFVPFLPASRAIHRFRGCTQPRRAQYSPFNHFFGQVDELLGEIDRQSQRQAHCEALRNAHHERQQRKRALRAQFVVNQTESGWQVDGDIQGFDQQNINIEVINDNTLKIAGNTQWQRETEAASDSLAESSTTTATTTADAAAAADVVDSALTGTPESDTESIKSHQATVEDDFEDLGAETASLISATSETSVLSESEDAKGKEKASEQSGIAENEKATVVQESQSHAQEQPEAGQDRVHGSFERTLQFPSRIDAANVRASFKDNVLSITIPRAPVQEKTRITIS